MKEKSKQLQTFILSLMMLIMGAAGAWADSTAEFTTLKSGGTGYSLEKGEITLGGGTESSDGYTVSSSGTLTITASEGYVVTGATITYEKDTNDRTGNKTGTASTGYSYSYSSAVGTLTKTGTATRIVSITYGANKARLVSATVTYSSGGATTYSVTYYSNLVGATGTVTDGNKYAAGDKVTTAANTYSKYGYTFLGWSTSDGYQSSYTTVGNKVTMVAGGLNLYAQWQLDSDVTALPAGDSTVPAGATITTSTTLGTSGIYAAWGNAAQSFETVIAQTKKSSPRNDAMSSGDPGDTKVLSVVATDGTFYSAVQTFNYTVGVATPTITCSDDGVVTISCATAGASIYYTLDGSEPLSSSTSYSGTFNLTASKTVKAIAIKNAINSAVASQSFTIYSVTYNGNENTGGDAPSTAYYKSGANVTVAGEGTLVKSGNTFNGWNTQANGSGTPYSAGGTISSISANTELFAQWTPAATLYTVTFSGNSHGTPASASITQAGSGLSITLPNCTANEWYQFQGWSTSPSASAPDTGLTAGSSYTPGDDIILYAVYKMCLRSSVSPEGAGTVVMKENNSSGNVVASGSYVSSGTYWAQPTPNTGYTFSNWSSGWSGTDNPLTFSIGSNPKTIQANFTAKTYSITLNANGGSAAGSATATYKSNALTSVSAPTYADMVVEGYYEEAGCTHKIADASGNLQVNTTYTDASGNWTNDGAVILYAKWKDAPSASTTLPVTFDFTNTTYWPTSTDFSGANQANLTIHDDSNNHEIVFHGTSTTEFDIDGSGLEIGQNGATNHFIAIPISGINGRIDIDVWAPYSSSSSFKIRGKLDTNGTTAQTSAGSLNTLNVNKYDTDHFNFRIKDISATEGVLYIGRNGSSYPCIKKIRITTAAANLVPDKASVFMGDAEKDTTVVTITNNSPYNVLVKTVPSYVNATYEPSTGKLTITPKAVGSGGNIELCVDTNGDGDAGDTDLSIPVTVTGITKVTAPTSAVYDTSSGSYSPALTALSVTATKSATGNTGTPAYQWYSNTVNSNTGGTVISGATDNTLSTDKISTTDSEKAAFYYCVVSLPGDSCKSVASDVAYVLTSKSKRYFHMSNVAGNRQTSDESEKITGEIVAGGTATAIHGADSYYRYITRPSSSYAHMYVVSNANNYIKINLKNAIATDDVISVLQMGNQGTGAGIKIATDANGSNAINIYQDGTDTKTYSATFTAAFNGVKEIYILGKYTGHQNYFTDLYISKPVAPEVSAPSPAEQTVAANATPSAISVTATLGTGSYTYQWKQCATVDGEYTDVSTGNGGTTASYTPAATATLGTTYYKCVVTSGGFTTTSSAASVTVASEGIDYFTLPTDGTYTVGKCVFNLTRHNSGAMFSAGRKYWYINDVLNGSATANYFTNDSTSVYMKSSSRAKSIKFYVKGASGFKIVCGNKDDGRTYKLTIDGDVKGNYNPTTSESEFFALNSESGSTIIISNVTSDILIKQFIFYEYEQKATTLTVQKDGETVTTATQYLGGDGEAEYEVSTNGNGTITAVSGTPSVATVSYNSSTGILTVTPVAAGTSVITITHPETSLYEEKVTTLTVTVKKHTLKLAFSYEKATFKASSLTENNQWHTGSLPVLTATLDGEDVSLASYTIHYETDEKNVAYFGASQSTSSLRTTSEEISDGSSYRIRWGGSQGGARIYAYVTNPGANVSSEVVYFDLVVEAGTSNNLPKGTHPTEQDQFELQNSEGVTVVTLTYGGYKYKKENGWSAASAKGKYYIDGYANYTRHTLDSYDEYGYQLKGMSDEATGPTTSKDATKIYSFNTWSSQNVGSHKFWYEEGTAKPGGGTYGKYERIRPFTLPCRGGYLKFEPKQTGKLTVYVWQNGVIGRGSEANQIGSKPRLGYWFDAEGWVQTPSVDPVSKQPISNGNGRDTHTYDEENLDAQMTSQWKAANGDADIIPALRYQYCDNADAPTSYSATQDGGHPYINPYYWMLDSEVSANNAQMIPKKMKPLMYHNGYFVPEDSYVKYVLNVVAGKTYYFQGMMTKIGYVGMNFVEDESVISSFAHNESLHLNATDNMATVVSGQTKDITVYDEVTLPSNYKKNQWSTICLPFALSENQVEEAFGKGTQLTLYNGAIKKSAGIYTVKYLSHVDRNILPGQAYFIKPTGVDANGVDLENVGGVIGSAVEGAPDTKTRITFNTVCIDKTNFSTSTSYGSNIDVNEGGTSLGQEGYVFVGAYNNETLPKYSYIVSGGLLRQFTGIKTKIPTYYAYLKPNTSASQSGSYSLTVDFNEENVENAWVADSEDEPTDVISMEAIADAMNNGKVLSGKAYNMMGQEVDPRSAKGMVIINGKKIMK